MIFMVAIYYVIKNTLILLIWDYANQQMKNFLIEIKKIYGVLPYVAPEVLRGKKYTQASDIYGFGIIAHEVCTGLPPFHDIAHDEFLAAKICQGSRPKSDYKIPQLILDIISQCWDVDPSKRPKADKLEDLLFDLYRNVRDEKDSLIHEQTKEAEEINK